MSEIFLFGLDIKRAFYPLRGTEPLLLPSQTPSIYVFADAPTRDEAQNGTGAVQTVSTWNEDTVEPYPRRYTIAAIDDPDPDSQIDEKWYWEAINFVNQDSEQTQTVIRAFRVIRAAGVGSIPGTSVEDLKRIYPAIESYLGNEELAAMLSTAETELKQDLEDRGLVWSKLFDLDKLRLALAFKAIALANLSQLVESNDKFAVRSEIFERKYTGMLTKVNLPMDSGTDGAPDVAVKPSLGAWVVDR